MAFLCEKWRNVTSCLVNEVYAKNDAGLTVRQWRIYAAFYSGYSQQQIADMFCVTRGAVGMCITRARKANPNLPSPARSGSRHTKQFSQLENKGGKSALKALGAAA